MILQETFLIIINVKKRFAAEFFVEIQYAGYLMNKKFKRTALIAFITLIDSIFHITNVFTHTHTHTHTSTQAHTHTRTHTHTHTHSHTHTCFAILVRTMTTEHVVRTPVSANTRRMKKIVLPRGGSRQTENHFKCLHT